MTENDCSVEEKQLSRRMIFFGASCLIVLLLIVLFSSVDKATFMANYRGLIHSLPISDSSQRYLISHYKLGHPLCYAILAAITCLCLKNRYILSILLVFSLGASLEIVQYFLPTRAASWVDLGYNLVGVIAGTAIIWGLKSLSLAETQRRQRGQNQ